MYDLIILGAGPAGCSAAITAARAGVRVLLLERGAYPRQKVCGEFVSAESLQILTRLLAEHPESIQLLQRTPRISSGRLFVDHSALEAPINPAAASIPRYDLDQHLWSAALQAGVDARQQQTVLTLAGNGPFRITTSDNVFESRALINCTGRWSNLSKRNGTNGRPKWIGLKAHFAEYNRVASVDLYFFRGGYCGVQPVNESEEINVCAMVRSDVGASLSTVFEQHPALRDRSQRWTQTTDVVSTSPLLFTEPEPTDDNNILLAGDAAGFIDPFVGDGISLALRSGKMASECIQSFFKNRLNLSDAAANYRRQYERSFLPVFRTSSTIRRLFALPYPARAALLFLFERTPALTRYLVRKTR